MSDHEIDRLGQLSEQDRGMAGLNNVEEAPVQKKAEYREAQFGKIYEVLSPNSEVDISAHGGIFIEIDVDNLDLEKVSKESLAAAWEKNRDKWTEQCKNLGITLDPYTVFKYYNIQRKVFSVLGKPTENQGARRERMVAANDRVKLSEMKDNAMCSEYATLATYIAQKIGESAKLIVGSVLIGDEQWREAHAYVWIEGENIILDAVQAQQLGEFPALMIPENGVTLQDMERGFDIRAKRIGIDFSVIYGLEAGGFGAKLKENNPSR
jgi:hypothetical protein